MERAQLPPGPPPKFHETFGNAPPEIQAFVGQNNLSPIVESLKLMADTFGAKVVGPKRNRATFPGAGEFKLLWGINELAQPTDNARWGWEGPIDRTEAKQLEAIDAVEQEGELGGQELDPMDVMTLAIWGNYFDQVSTGEQDHLIQLLNEQPSRVASWFDHFVATGETVKELEARTGASVWTPAGAQNLQQPTGAQLQAVAAGAYGDDALLLEAAG